MKELADKHLLLLEDNIEFIDNAVALFQMFVALVFVAHTIQEAFALLAQEPIHIIISDVHLKNENGLDFIKEVRKKDAAIPILVLSGRKDQEFLFRAMTLGLSGYLLKPINFKMLTDALGECAKKIETHSQMLIPLKEGYMYDKALKKLIKDGSDVELNKKEILFFEMLCENKERLLTKDMFLAHVYEYEPMSDSALNNFIMRLRRRFGKTFIHTIPDVGYKLIV
jgi:DNA-binding response OmpR family regulator